MEHEKKEGKKKSHHGFVRTHMEHHKDGSITIHHEHEMPEHDVKHAVSDLDGAHDSMEDNLGMPNPGEAEANAGQSGIPGEQEAMAAGATPAVGQ